MSRLEDLCAATLARPADQQALEFEGRWHTWGDLRGVAERLEASIAASGAGADATIGLVARNHPSSIAALLGLIAKGRSVRMIYAFQSAAAMARDVERARPAVLVTREEDFGGDMRKVLGDHGIAGVALRDLDVHAMPGLERAHTAIGSSSGASAPRIEILTSGTTGAPKPFALTFDVIARHMIGAGVSATGGMQDLSAQPPTLLFFPLSNISGIYSTLPALLKGQRAVLLERFNIPGWHDHLMRYRPEASGMPPAGVQMLLDANIPREDLSCIRRFGTGAAPLDPAVQRAFEDRYGIPILLSYGATEFGGPVAAMTLDLHAEWGRRKFGSVGRAMPGAQLRVVDPQSGEPLPPGEEGILEVISPRIGPDWIRTSDVAVIDADGFLFHRGRADGAIMRGGFKVLPETIERALLLHPAVAAAAVVGIPHERLGQVPAAAMEIRAAAPAPTAADLEAHLREHIASTHIPAAWRFVSALPRNSSFKIDRPAVKRLFEDDGG